MGAQRLLTINTGPSSQKVALYRLREDTTETPEIRAEASRIGPRAATSVVVLRTGVMLRWLALAGFVAALFAPLRFLIPLEGILGLVWVLVVSVFLLMGFSGSSVWRSTAVGP